MSTISAFRMSSMSFTRFCWLVTGCILVSYSAPASAFLRPTVSRPPAGATSRLARPRPTTARHVYDHVAGVDSQLLFDTWEWNANLASPAALVAGAVLATLIDGREAMSAKVTDKKWVINLKKMCRLLLLSSFGLEVLSIFVTVVMGTLLLSLGDVPSAIVDTTANSPMVCVHTGNTSHFSFYFQQWHSRGSSLHITGAHEKEFRARVSYGKSHILARSVSLVGQCRVGDFNPSKNGGSEHNSNE